MVLNIYKFTSLQVGDGTTSVIVLAGEMLAAAEQFLEQQMHPTVIIRQYRQALEDMVQLLEGPLSLPVNRNDKAALAQVVSNIIEVKIIKCMIIRIFLA